MDDVWRFCQKIVGLSTLKYKNTLSPKWNRNILWLPKISQPLYTRSLCVVEHFFLPFFLRITQEPLNISKNWFYHMKQLHKTYPNQYRYDLKKLFQHSKSRVQHLKSNIYIYINLYIWLMSITKLIQIIRSLHRNNQKSCSSYGAA